MKLDNLIIELINKKKVQNYRNITLKEIYDASLKDHVCPLK